MKERSSFNSRIGAILAAAGSAVGLGNIWRFPCETGEHGGAAFILLYIFCILIIGVPVLIAEMATGRASRANAYDTYVRLSNDELTLENTQITRDKPMGSRKWLWRFFGSLTILGGFAVLSYYSVVAGWTLEYTYQAFGNSFYGQTSTEITQSFGEFCADPFRPIICLCIFISITAGIVILGVQRGIEMASKLMMPLLLVILIILGICSLTLPGATDGLEFLFKPDFSKITMDVALDAMGQAFFTLSVGIGCLMTYASYFSANVNILKDSYTIAIIDTLVAILAGIIIFPAVMTVGINPEEGPTLVFITLPTVFQQAFGNIPWLCYCVTLLFYLLLSMAALTSSISMLEITTSFVSEKLHIKRWQAAVILSVITIIAGTCCSLGFGIWSDITPFGMNIFDLFDFFVAKFAMPIGGIALCFLVRRLGKDNFRKIVDINGTLNSDTLIGIQYFLLRWIIPLLIFIIFINEL